MASKGEASAERAAFAVVGQLVKAADIDTAFRDLYLHRAAARLAPFMDESTYRKLEADKARIDVLLRQLQAEVARQDWPRVKALSSGVELVREDLRKKDEVRSLAASVYDADGVRVDPFALGVGERSIPKGETRATLRTAVLVALAELAKADPDNADLYEERRAYFERLDVSTADPSPTKSEANRSVAELRREAQIAADRGEVGRLQRLADEIMQASARVAAPAVAEPPADAPAAPTATEVSSEPFSDECLAAAKALGIEQVCTKEQVAGFHAAVTEFMAKYSWQPDVPADEAAKHAASRMRERLEGFELPPGMEEHKESFIELAALFALHPFVNSCGVRYWLPGPGEHLLLEAFPEDIEPPKDSELLSLLGLSRRRGLARVEIEDALWRRGPSVLRERLGLDPRLFRLVCVPFDLYNRVGAERGWGAQEQWTHADGYGVQRGGRLGALAVGHARYGGLLDLMILSRTDRRDSVVARFAVVRRTRLLPATA